MNQCLWGAQQFLLPASPAQVRAQMCIHCSVCSAAMLQDGVHAAFFLFFFPPAQTKTDRGKNTLTSVVAAATYYIYMPVARASAFSSTISTRKECFKSGQASHLSSPCGVMFGLLVLHRGTPH